ncbi:cell division protein DedD [Shewanella morhuae]|uniref:cell division protein DedD n=1 Tax=Shewanella morhuae TaxID=365591 RepID=UPI001BC522A2|nr:cell division protein DedD [Shewanella morhuae]GIU09438.1 sporulation protein [Shewanella morhuae]
MSSQFHNRLVGTVVLVALGVLFLPDILDGKKDHQEEQFSEIPLRPTVIEQQKADDMFEVLSVDGELSSNEPALAADAQANADNQLEVAVKESSKPDAKAEIQPEIKKAEVKKEPLKATVKAEAIKKSESKPVAVAKVEKAKVEKPKVTAPKVNTAKEAEVKTVSRDNIKSGFTLQLGGFNNAANVKTLVAQLRKNGFKAYTIPATPKDGVLTKVFVGPDVSEAKLKKIQIEVETLTRLKGWIIPFNPLES